MSPAPPPGRAARLHGRRDLRLGDEAAPIPGRGEQLVRVTAVGLCGSDLHWYEDAGIGGTDLAAPLVLGHEVAGVITGGDRDGERVAVDPAIPCGVCEQCRSGRGRLCPDIRFAGLAPDDGGLRSWIAWPASRLVPVPAVIPDHEVPLLEVLGIAIHALDLAGIAVDGSARHAPPVSIAAGRGLRVGVYGAGPVGLVLIRALRAAGVDDILATDLLAHRVEAALASGASSAILVEDGVPDGAVSRPVDIAFECAGTDAALDTAVRAVDPGGRVLLIGIPSAERSSFPAAPARRKEIDMQHVRRMEGPDLGRAVALVAGGRLALGGLVSHRLPLEAAPEAFELLAARAGLKIVVEPAARA